MSRLVIAVFLESTPRRTFASACDWPGWCRSGKTEETALQALAASSQRYSPVAAAAGLKFKPAEVSEFEVVERLPGSATTDFGAPGAVAAAEAEPVTAADADRMEALLRACWEMFDRVVAKAPAELRKGPRGGGRDRDQIVAHVSGAEGAYAARLGLRLKPPVNGDRKAIKQWRELLIGALRETPDGTAKGWPARYAARRIAWHVLDHAWEIEDRTA